MRSKIIFMVCSMCFAMASHASVTFMPKAVNGEIDCIGGDGISDKGEVTNTNFVFRNLDNVRAIAFTRVRLYNETGQLVADLLQGDFPPSFKEIISPGATATMTSTELLAGKPGGRLLLKVNFRTTDGRVATVPHVISGMHVFDSAGNLVNKDTLECVLNR